MNLERHLYFSLLPLLALAACGPAADPPPAGERWLVPEQVTLLGPQHGRTIVALERDSAGALVIAASERVRGPTSALGAAVTVLDGAPPFATELVSSVRGIGDGYGRDRLPEIVLGPPHGAGRNQGSTDTLSLGLGGTIALGFPEYSLYDGPGPDLLIFENAFHIAASPETFAEPAHVALQTPEGSRVEFSCDLTGWPHAGCAGIQPVLAGPAFPDVDPTDPERAGGDAFDLATLELAEARQVFLEDTGTGTITGSNSGFDLDAVALVHVLPRDATALQPAQPSIETVAGTQLPMPRFDILTAGGRTLRGAAVSLSAEPALELFGTTHLLAKTPGRAVLTARAGHLSASVVFDIAPANGVSP